MWLGTTCNLEFQMMDATPMVLMLRPRSGIQQWVAKESYSLMPSVPVIEYTDIFGNLCQRLVAPAGYFSVSTSAQVLTSDEVDKSPGAPGAVVYPSQSLLRVRSAGRYGP